MKGPRGWLVAIEGIDGAGKSTFQSALARRLAASGGRIRRAAEPRNRKLGNEAVSVARTDPWRAAILFSQDRMLSRPRIERWIRAGCMVITDRSFYSTLAYQGSALPPRAYRHLAELQHRIARQPDRVLFLRLDPTIALRRLTLRGTSRSSLEQLAILRRVDRAYRRLSRDPRWITLDGQLSVRELVEEGIRRLLPLLRRSASVRRPRK
ncbi:MAG TPA: dTMP kinase [Thermoplasmata archaeon]|nr:dTMP kinase [Thermoplasmata archaeon]